MGGSEVREGNYAGLCVGPNEMCIKVERESVSGLHSALPSTDANAAMSVEELSDTNIETL